MNDIEMQRRLAVFVDAGLLERIPTTWQIRQGELEMTPYVISTDATAEEGYRDRAIAHPLVRQLVLLSHVGRDHLRSGSALDASLESICAHLVLTFHRGMPGFDLQIIQTHPGGLARLAAAVEEALARSTALGKRRWGIAAALFANPSHYLEQFLGDSGWIARAARFDYESVASAGSKFPPEFFTLAAFLGYCARQFPAVPREVGWAHMPAHVATLATRRFREGRRMGWFA